MQKYIILIISLFLFHWKSLYNGRVPILETPKLEEEIKNRERHGQIIPIL